MRVFLAICFFFPLLGWGSCFDTFQTEAETRAFQYFLDHTHPVSGLVRDRARNFGSTPERGIYQSASIAATGFGLAVIANASLRGFIPRSEAIKSVGKTLRFVHDRMFRYHGWFHHFVRWDTGERFGKSEISTIDTALLIAGALYAAHALQSDSLIDLATDLHDSVDYIGMMTDGGAKPNKKTLSMGWSPENGYLPWQWGGYAEHLVMLVLGIGHSQSPLPLEAWQTWKKPEEKIIGRDLPLFVHQYSHLFVDFREIATPKEDLFKNSIRATQYNLETCRAKAGEFSTYQKGFWGLSAGDSATGYEAFSPANHDGTVCPACVGGSAMFLACPILGFLSKWANGPYRARLWGKYGFSDSLNLDRNWFASDVIGITVGAFYLSLANTTQSTSVWRVFHEVPAVQRGLERIK